MTAPTPTPPEVSAAADRTGPTVVLRPLTAEDVPAVHKIETAASPDPWSESLFEDELAPGGPPRHWLVALDGLDAETIIGFGGVLFLADEAHIMNIAVAPDRQRQGVAARLLAGLLLTAGDRGAIGATLEVRPSNAAAIALYRRFRFEEAGRRPRYYDDGEAASIMWAHGIHRTDYRALLEAALAGAGPGPSTQATEGTPTDD